MLMPLRNAFTKSLQMCEIQAFFRGRHQKNLAFISLKACVTKNRIFCKSDDAWMKKGRGAEEKIAKIGRMWKMRLLFNIWAF